MIAEAQLNATLALVALTIETKLNEKQTQRWLRCGYRRFD